MLILDRKSSESITIKDKIVLKVHTLTHSCAQISLVGFSKLEKFGVNGFTSTCGNRSVVVHKGDELMLDELIGVYVLSFKGNRKIRLGFEAPKDIAIFRTELL